MASIQIKACPFCGLYLVEAETFRTHLTRTYVHPADVDCSISGMRVVVDPLDGHKQLERWNTRRIDMVEASIVYNVD